MSGQELSAYLLSRFFTVFIYAKIGAHITVPMMIHVINDNDDDAVPHDGEVEGWTTHVLALAYIGVHV